MNRKGLFGSISPTSCIGFWVAGLPFLLLLAAGAITAGASLGAYLIFSADLPAIPDLKAYRPKTVSRFYAEDGSVIGVFYKEKRFPLAYDAIPQLAKDAFLAAEDARFFTHKGVDFKGVIRAFVTNLRTGSYAQGGSTITQQVTRNLLLTNEKKVKRKIREALLSYRLEQALTKEEILNIYLNEIYLGNGAYGIEAAAQTYFNKPCTRLTVAEAALVAGLAASPTKYSPTRNREAALQRRDYVLSNMLKHGFINHGQYEEAIHQSPQLGEEQVKPSSRAPYFTEAVRQYIMSRYGEALLYRGRAPRLYHVRREHAEQGNRSAPCRRFAMGKEDEAPLRLGQAIDQQGSAGFSQLPTEGEL